MNIYIYLKKTDMVAKSADYKFKNLRVFFVWPKIHDNSVHLTPAIMNINL